MCHRDTSTTYYDNVIRVNKKWILYEEQRNFIEVKSKWEGKIKLLYCVGGKLILFIALDRVSDLNM